MNAATRIPLAAIHGSALDPMIMGSSKPQLTYSSVIQCQVKNMAERSPFLQSDMGKESLNAEFAHLYRDEILMGEILGQGNFSDVREVSQFCLCRPILADGQAKPGVAEKRRWQLRSNLRRSDGSPSYAVKCLKPELLEHPSPKVFLEAATDLVIEAKYLARFDHEHILKLRGISCGWEKAFANGMYDSFFIIVDRLEETLNKRIKRWKSGELPDENKLQSKLRLTRQLASALDYLADRQLLYRDLKPQNIGLARNPDNTLTVKLFDFGFCRQLPSIDHENRDDAEDEVNPEQFTTLPSGETVYVMSGKGTRRYMSPEVVLHSRYNLKADVYSWAMVTWELLLLQKPYCKYSKDEHLLFVCKGGDRPPLEQTSASIWPTASLQSLSASLSSLPGSFSGEEDTLDFDAFMTDPIRDLLTHAWDQDIEQRFTMKQAVKELDNIIGQKEEPKVNFSTHRMSLRNMLRISSQSTTPANEKSPNPRGYSCLSSAIAEYRGVREIVVELSNEIPDLPFIGCFNRNQKSTNTIPVETSEEPTSEIPTTFNLDRENDKLDESNPEPKTFRSPVPQLNPLLVQ